MRHVLCLAAAVALVSLACGTEPQAASPKQKRYVTTFALVQVEADLGKGAIVVTPVDDDSDDDDVGCNINGLSYSNCTVDTAQPPELHVNTTLCELRPDAPTETRLFTECRPAAPDILTPVEIPHCPGEHAPF